LSQHFSQRKTKFRLQRALSTDHNIEIKSRTFIVDLNRQNLAKNISPFPKGLMGFILFGRAIFWFGWLKPPPPQAHAWLCPCLYHVSEI